MKLHKRVELTCKTVTTFNSVSSNWSNSSSQVPIGPAKDCTNVRPILKRVHERKDGTGRHHAIIAIKCVWTYVT